MIYDGGWKYDSNTAGYYAFTPRATDILVAAVDFDVDTVTDPQGQRGVEHGMALGYAFGDPGFEADKWPAIPTLPSMSSRRQQCAHASLPTPEASRLEALRR